MKKKFVVTVASMMALTAAFSACGGGTAGNSSKVEIDPTKTQLYISAWNVGFGLD